MFVLYRDIRTYGFSEQYYRLAREKGVRFIRYEPEAKPVVSATESGLRVEVRDPILAEDAGDRLRPAGPLGGDRGRGRTGRNSPRCSRCR